MAFCENCGEKVSADAKFCPKCGKAIGDGGSAPDKKIKDSESAPSKKIAVSGSAPAVGGQDAQDNKVMAVLAYILFFIPLLTGDHNKSPFVKYHTNQGLVLFLAAIAWGIAYGILAAIFSAVFIAVGAYALLIGINMILGLTWFIPLILCILGIVNAVRGVMKPLPIIGRITILK